MGVDDPRCVSSAEDVRVFFGLLSYILCRPGTSPPLQWLRETIKPVAAGGSFPSVSAQAMLCQDIDKMMHSSSDVVNLPHASPPLLARTGSASSRSRRSMTLRGCSGTRSGRSIRMALRFTRANMSQRNRSSERCTNQ